MENITNRISIHLGDCYELVDSWPEDAALVTDPPYGIGYDHSGGTDNVRQSAATRARRAKTHGVTICGDDRPFDPTPFLRFKTVLLWGADKFRLRLPEGGSLLSWNKNDGTGPADNFSDAEFAWTNREKVKRNAITYLWKGLCCVKKGEDNGVRYHPNLKPQGVCEWSLRILELPPDTLVIDAFAGSGSLGVTCARMGLRYIGCEISPHHYAVMRERVSRAVNDNGLFSGCPKCGGSGIAPNNQANASERSGDSVERIVRCPHCLRNADDCECSDYDVCPDMGDQ